LIQRSNDLVSGLPDLAIIGSAGGRGGVLDRLARTRLRRGSGEPNAKQHCRIIRYVIGVEHRDVDVEHPKRAKPKTQLVVLVSHVTSMPPAARGSLVG